MYAFILFLLVSILAFGAVLSTMRIRAEQRKRKLREHEREMWKLNQELLYRKKEHSPSDKSDSSC